MKFFTNVKTYSLPGQADTLPVGAAEAAFGLAGKIDEVKTGPPEICRLFASKVFVMHVAQVQDFTGTDQTG